MRFLLSRWVVPTQESWREDHRDGPTAAPGAPTAVDVAAAVWDQVDAGNRVGG